MRLTLLLSDAWWRAQRVWQNLSKCLVIMCFKHMVPELEPGIAENSLHKIYEQNNRGWHFNHLSFLRGWHYFKILQIQYQQLAAEHRQHHLSLKTGSAPADKKMLVEHTVKNKKEWAQKRMIWQKKRKILTQLKLDYCWIYSLLLD